MARKPRAEAPAVPMPVRLSPAERERVQEAARVNNQKVSDFCRDALMCAAEDCLETPRHLGPSIH
jgi:uncharacterized protein (DUF1778 family)